LWSKKYRLYSRVLRKENESFKLSGIRQTKYSRNVVRVTPWTELIRSGDLGLLLTAIVVGIPLVNQSGLVGRGRATHSLPFGQPRSGAKVLRHEARCDLPR
jgi:hypothetical protein